jgi:hypothetical protein
MEHHLSKYQNMDSVNTAPNIHQIICLSTKRFLRYDIPEYTSPPENVLPEFPHKVG